MSEANVVGNWALIGYKMASSTNFTYAGDDVDAKLTCPTGSKEKEGACVLESDATKTAAEEGATITDDWTAKNNVNLNDCAALTPKFTEIAASK